MKLLFTLGIMIIPFTLGIKFGLIMDGILLTAIVLTGIIFAVFKKQINELDKKLGE